MRKALYLLADLNDADLTWFADVGSARDLRAGAVLIDAGDAISSTFIVLDGHLDVVAADGAVIARLTTGDIVGEMSLIQQQPPVVSVVADEFSATSMDSPRATSMRLFMFVVLPTVVGMSTSPSSVRFSAVPVPEMSTHVPGKQSVIVRSQPW